MRLQEELRRTASAVVGRAALRRWAFLILGGAMLTPYWFVMNIVGGLLFPKATHGQALLIQFGAYLATLPLVAATAAAFPFIRPLEAAMARTLLGIPLPEQTDGTSRGRTAAWAVLHLGLGALVAGSTLAIPPAVVALLLRPLVGPTWAWVGEVPAWPAPFAGLFLLAGLLSWAWAAGRVLERTAPALLGPSAAERLAEAEWLQAKLAERNRLARELHDSVGHALSVVTLQAAAAGRVLDQDPEFARRALAAIEEASRGAIDELDHVLGLLREEGPRRAPLPDLRDVERLAESARTAGSPVELVLGDFEPVPAVVSREAYRIVQEGLTNALKHAAGSPIEVAVGAAAGELVVVVANAVPERRGITRRRDGKGGRGARGIVERAELLGGSAEVGPADGMWRITARLPLAPIGRAAIEHEGDT